MQKSKFKFTPENLLDNLTKLGAWSSRHLTEIAVRHFYPEVDAGDLQAIADVQPEWWFTDWIRKYHSEVGYTEEQLADSRVVNSF